MLMKTIYRILAPICCLGAIPILFFLPLFRINISSSLSSSLVNAVGMKEYSSMYDMFKTFLSDDSNTLIRMIVNAMKDGESKLAEMLTSKNYLYVFAVFFVLLIVFLLLAAIFSLIGKKFALSGAFTAAAIVSCFGMNMSFNAFAKPFLNGQISLSSLLSEGGGILSNILGSLAKVEHLNLAIAYQLTLFLLIISAILWICAVVEKNYNK